MSFVSRTPELETKVIDLYNSGLSAGKIIKEIKIYKTKKSIYDILDKYKISRRGLSEANRRIGRDSNFFSIIDSQAKAYILGLMITDGWITKTNYLGFSSIDKSLTLFIRDKISPKTSITEISRKIKQSDLDFFSSNSPVFQTGYQIQLADLKIVEDLKRLGIQVNKTRNEALPYLRDEFMPHMLRGIIDGDGCIYKISGVDQAAITIYSGSDSFLKHISIYFYIKLGIEPPVIQPANTISKISYHRKDYVSKLGNFLYENSEIKLERKFERWKRYEN